MNTIQFLIFCFVVSFLGLFTIYFIRLFIIWKYEEYVTCYRKISSYRYKQTVIELNTIRDTISQLLNYSTVLVPIKISTIKINNVIHQLKYPIIYNHHCELNDEYIRMHYPSIYKCRCLATIDVCKIKKNTLFYTLYEYQKGCLELIDYDGDIKEINDFCKQLRNLDSRIYKMSKFEACQWYDNCPFVYIDPINETNNVQKHSECIMFKCFRKLKNS